MLKVEISYRGIIMIALSLLAVWAFIELWPVLLLVLVSLIFMLGLLPFADALSLRMPRPTAVILILVVVLAVIVGLFSMVVPAVVSEFASVRDNLPDSAREGEEFLHGIGIDVELEDRAREINWNELVSGRAAVDYGQRILTLTVSIITIIAMTAYLLADTPRLGRFVNQFIPEAKKEDANLLFLSLVRVVGGYLRGQLVTSLAIGVFSFIFLSALGVPNPLAFAVLAAVADVVPLVGSIIATVPPAAAALQDSPTKALAVIVGFVIYQQFEDRILAPRVYGRTLNLPPIIVLVAVLAGAELLGIVGALLALPLAAACRVAIDYAISTRQIPLILQVDEQPLAPDSPKPARRRATTRRRAQAPRAKTGANQGEG